MSRLVLRDHAPWRWNAGVPDMLLEYLTGVFVVMSLIFVHHPLGKRPESWSLAICVRTVASTRKHVWMIIVDTTWVQIDLIKDGCFSSFSVFCYGPTSLRGVFDGMCTHITFPDTPCMPYLPTLWWFQGSM